LASVNALSNPPEQHEGSDETPEILKNKQQPDVETGDCQLRLTLRPEEETT